MDRNSRAWAEEEQRKEFVYSVFEGKHQQASADVQAAAQYYQSGRYEDQDAFLAHGPLSIAHNNKRELEMEIKALYDKPYFAHIRITDKDDGDSEHFLISDSERLDHEMKIAKDMSIIPFIYMPERPLLDKLRTLPNLPSGEDFTVNGYTYTPNLIRNIDVFRKELRGVETLFTDAQEDEQEEYFEADELLIQKLQENRKDAHLRNIISTLQQRQFSIIQSDIGLSFVVQGCAGSGKTQCLIHRLFFLRESLSAGGWDKVLLITPTQLFRNYSSELMKRYRLTDVTNCSLAEFYHQLLLSYDQRFRNRQYQLEMTEEYLPDKYLRQVYAPENIRAIETEIQKAIHRHVAEGCALAGIEYDDNVPITIDFVNRIAQRLADDIKRFDDTEKAFSDDLEYREHRDAINALDKQMKALQRKQAELLETHARLSSSKEQFDQLTEDVEKARAEEKEWEQIIEGEENKIVDEIAEYAEAANSARDAYFVSISAKRYAKALSRLIDSTVPEGKQAQYNKSYREILHEITHECQEALNSFLKKQTSISWLRNYEQRYQANQTQLTDVETDIELNQLFQDDHTAWLQEHRVEDVQKQKQAYRADLEHARYYLSRIESSVFEQEVWNALTPLKKECDIETLQKEHLEDGHQRQTRILYKSDLLFYLKIYTMLHPTRDIHGYNLICIDEGQDMHEADYQLMREIYPHAVLNIFGDTEQVLHEACGISDWKRETKIETVHTMNDNYRNTPAIVDFCNTEFGSNMHYFGNISEEQRPKVIDNTDQLLNAFANGVTTVILKDREYYKLLCKMVGDRSCSFEYIDTKCDAVPEGKIACFSIYAAKGLEFTKVLVFAEGMTRNQRIVACTRAMDQLYYFD